MRLRYFLALSSFAIAVCARCAEAIRFAVEVLAPKVQRGAAMEVGEQRFEFDQIFGLYTNDRYPLNRASSI